MSIRCKFKVDQINRINSSRSVEVTDPETGKKSWKSEPVEMRSVTMSPVYANGDPSHENSKFWNATPSGQLQFNSVNLEAVDALELGAEYYIDIAPAPKP
jgi:hypothetical protein